MDCAKCYCVSALIASLFAARNGLTAWGCNLLRSARRPIPEISMALSIQALPVGDKPLENFMAYCTRLAQGYFLWAVVVRTGVFYLP